jgi:alpha-tubulin suppressor-like RCC1 family protein
VRDAVEIASGTGHFCVRDRQGAVWCWGANEAGQTGASMRVRIDAPSIVPGLKDATTVAMAHSTACAIRSGGRVACWGGGYGNALGDGDARDRPSPADVPLPEPVVALAAGGTHFCALEKKGTVRCWGEGGRRRLCDKGDEECAKSAAVPGLADAVDVSAFRDATCAVRKTGGIACWGSEHDIGEQVADPPKGSITPVAQIANAARVFVGYRRACAVRKDGTAACWGDDVGFELRQRPAVKDLVVEIDGARDLVAIGRGQPDHALSRGGELRAFDWGNSFAPNIPPDKPPRIAAPPKLLLSGVAQIAQDFTRACARLKTGEVSCWDAQGAPQPTGIADAVDVDLSEGGAVCVVRRTGEVACWGENEHGECGVASGALVSVANRVEAPR